MKVGMRAATVHAPEQYTKLLGPLPGVRLGARLSRDLDFVHAFFVRTKDLEREFPQLRDGLAKAGMLWISWPKKSSPLAGDLDENGVRAIGLAAGLVDVKICAVDEDWSALKFVRRLADR
ncbi:MAG TPA: DUF3052 domain-containing protein [Thermoanaerobaculia bacterium]|nr:DUF3052 domain-containing protein [Thermoanaerobaculia bacterium]